MTIEKIDLGIDWFIDKEALGRGEPGLTNSFISSVAGLLNYLDGSVDPVWLMGVTGFAFKICAGEKFTNCGMTAFNRPEIIREVFRIAGYECELMSTSTSFIEQKEEIYSKTCKAIKRSLNNGIPVLAWDNSLSKWALIKGYDDLHKCLLSIIDDNRNIRLDYQRPWLNGTMVLNIAAPGEKISEFNDNAFDMSLVKALSHSMGEAKIDRTGFRTGLAAYKMLAMLFEWWASGIETNTIENENLTLSENAKICSAQIYSARCYARQYLAKYSDKNNMLRHAEYCYGSVASYLKPIWDYFRKEGPADADIFNTFASYIRNASSAEEQGLYYLREYLEYQKI